MKIILIGNYLPDQQESMIRFSDMLNDGFNNAGLVSEIWRPDIVFGKSSKNTSAGLAKWLGYIDKWILFPFILKHRLRKKDFKQPDTHFHICDHSNAPYLKYLPADRTGITCHDVIAIRSALFNNDAHVRPSFMGKKLQNWILSNLKKAKILAAVSQFTLDQLKEIIPENINNTSRWQVIYNSFNAVFEKRSMQKNKDVLSNAGINIEVPFLLHVGSGDARKNRKLLIDMLHLLNKKWNAVICFAGDAVEEELLLHAEELGLKKKLISIIKPNHEILVSLYNTADAFIFPSFSEGFGWPVIEAQACGTAVIASNYQPMPEISGGAALYADPYKPEDFANAFLSLQTDNLRSQLVEKGFENVRRFNASVMINAYLNLHGIRPHPQPFSEEDSKLEIIDAG